MGGTPDPIDPAKSYGEALSTYLKNLPQLLNEEQTARTTYDPQRIDEQQSLYDKYDPKYKDIRGAMEDNVLQGVQNGYALPPAFSRQLEQNIRGAQAARGNAYGNAPISAETVYKGQNAIDLYNRNLANAGTFLGMPSPAQPDRSAAYTVGGLSAATQIGSQAYGSQFQQANPWASALGGASSGAAVGTAISPGWGTLIGAAVGGAGGYFGSDRKLKADIKEVGKSPRGFGIYEFRYLDSPQRYRGLMADNVEQLLPEAVKTVGGYKMVKYDLTDVPFELLATN